MQRPDNPVGCDGKGRGTTMIARTAPKGVASSARSGLGLGAILLTALLGVSLLFVAGFAHSQVMHDAAHDTRHAVGFPCH